MRAILNVSGKNLLIYVHDGHIKASMKTNKMTLTPLTPAVFYILLALASGEKHGYEIMKQVKMDSQSQVKMGTGMLYGSLKRILADRLIEEVGEKPDPTHEDERRRYYRLTELQRYSQVVSIARQRSLLPNFSQEPGQ